MIWRIAIIFAAVLFVGALGAGALGVAYVAKLDSELPNYDRLRSYAPPVTTRIHAGDGTLIREYARELRLFVPIEAVPDHVKEAFLSAEDRNFYEHPGIDYMGVVRAAMSNVSNYLNDRRLEGASTITQQVAKNFLLSSEVKLERKLKEALLAFKIEKAFTKDQILELYLNEIYLGWRAYGVAAAALAYFDKSLDELTIAEAAYLAAMPKAPNNYRPSTPETRERGIERRNWVVARMQENGFITQAEMQAALAEPLVVTERPTTAFAVEYEYFAEEVRRQIAERFGADSLYDGGLSVRTTLDTRLQAAALDALRKGLVDYDRRHGWRGPVTTIELGEGYLDRLSKVPFLQDLTPWELAVVVAVDDADGRVRIVLRDSGAESTIPFAEMSWARAWREGQSLGPQISKPSEVLKAGDVVLVERAKDEAGAALDHFALRQLPAVNGALVAMDPHTGRVLAMVGGFSFYASEYNRAMQARRQPGSAFKPFVYAAALERGYTPSSIVLDAPFVIDQGNDEGLWKPKNYSDGFYGPSTLRLGIEKSRNLMTVRLAQDIGMEAVSGIASRFHIIDDMEPVLAMALGAGETTLMRMVAAYSMMVNGGHEITPTLLDRVQDRTGGTIYRNDQRECEGCRNIGWASQEEPLLPDPRARVIDERTAYQIVSMLEGVVQRGTATSVRDVGKPLAGKTGTTNDSHDAWFIGFAPDLAVGIYVGFDQPRSLGRGETGGGVAAPIFRDFMMVALEDRPATPFRIPPGIRLVRVSAKTGLPGGEGPVILEAFKAGSEPRKSDRPGGEAGYVDPETGAYVDPASGRAVSSGTGGLY
ncbi:MAG: penicillin-binding protein 1A [Alphaproteobacteria bacterium]|nr:penicillin-binding protein 1A [Alphaproteobacteria bacterium]